MKRVGIQLLTANGKRNYAGSSQHALGHIECEACEAARVAVFDGDFSAVDLLLRAAPIWLSTRQMYVKPRTIVDYATYIKPLITELGTLPLGSVHIGHIREYQRLRSRTVSASRVNHEVNTLSQILSRVGLWATIKQHYEPMPLPKSKVGRAMSDSQEQAIWDTAQQRKRWRVAYWAALLTANTTRGWSEIRHIKLGCLDLNNKMVFLSEGTKTDGREGWMPLNEIAFWAIYQLYERAVKLGACRPEHYLFPARTKSRGQHAAQTHDPARPQGSVRTAWEALRKAAGLPQLRYYDLRHHSLTKLLENPDISERTVETVAGHVSEEMKKRYSHIRQEALREAVAALGQIPAKKSSVTEIRRFAPPVQNWAGIGK